MGKTGATLLALADLLTLGDVERVLVVAPLRVAQTVWSDEVARWPGMPETIGPVVSITGSARARRRAIHTPARVHTVNYENLPSLLAEVGDDWPFDTVVCDEASKLRGFRTRQGTSRARALSLVAHTRVKRLYELTGTPAANSLAALWGQVWFLDRGARLGSSFEAFKNRWFSSTGEHGRAVLTPHAHAQRQITEVLSDLCLTLDPADWFDLQAPVYTRLTVDLPPKAKRIYATFRKEMYAALQDGERVAAFNAAAKTMKCLQLANGAAYTDDKATQWSAVHDAKLDALDGLVEESGEQVMVAYNFRSDKERLLARFPQAVDLAAGDGMAAFKGGSAAMGIAHPASVGHGVDGLQNVCRTLVFFGHSWDSELREQIIERVGPMRQHQAGLDRPLFLYDIVARGTIDQTVMARHESKRSVQDLLMEAMKKGE